MNSVIERLADVANLLEGSVDGLAGPYGGNEQEVNKFVELMCKQLIFDISMSQVEDDCREDWDKGYNEGLNRAISVIVDMMNNGEDK